MELRGASALVTGAGRGIGRAIALALGRAGVGVTGVARTASDLESLVVEIQRAGGRAVAHAGDIRDPAVATAAVGRAREAHGRLQILVNNAGVGSHAPVAETTDAGVNPIAGMAAYCASKAGLDHFSACLMLEVRQQGVKVTTICPGSVDTDFGDDGRSGDASWMLRGDDIAATVLDLLRARDEALLSRVEMRPLRPARRG